MVVMSLALRPRAPENTVLIRLCVDKPMQDSLLATAKYTKRDTYMEKAMEYSYGARMQDKPHLY